MSQIIGGSDEFINLASYVNTSVTVTYKTATWLLVSAK